MKTALFTTLASILVIFSFSNSKAETIAVRQQAPIEFINTMVPPHVYVSGRVILDGQGDICLMTKENVPYHVANGNGMMQSGRINVGDQVTARVIHQGSPSGMGEVTIIII